MDEVRSRLPDSPEWRLRRTKLPVVGFTWSPALNRLWQKLLWKMGQRMGWPSEHEDHQVHEQCPYCRCGGPPLYMIKVSGDWKSATVEELQIVSESAPLGGFSIVEEHFQNSEDAVARARVEGQLWSSERVPGLDPPHHDTVVSILDPEPYDPEYFFAPEGEWIEVAHLGSEES